MSKWRLACLGRLEVAHLWQAQWQCRFGQRIGHTVLVVDWERLTPVALAAEYSVPQAVVHLHTPKPRVGDVFFHLLYRLFYLQSVQEARVHHDALFSVETLFADIGSLNQRHNR